MLNNCISKCTGWVLLTVCAIYIVSCSGPQRGIFASKTPHEKYMDNITKAGLDKTTLGQLWINAAGKALRQPLPVTLPYKETGYFAADNPGVAGYRFNANRGDKLVIAVNKKPVLGFALFLDLWESEINKQPDLLVAADSAGAGLEYEVRRDGEYVLRLQPELLSSGEYTLTIQTAPSLAFPVQTTANPRIASFWGDARDAGARKHEGIDIFGRFRTPLLAASDGVIRSAGNNNLGGKVIFMRPSGKDYVLYYAHLDSQLVTAGQRVKLGDTIGLMGNTGNARSTPPHLHFGIYARGGAINPLPFVKRNRPEPEKISASLNRLNDFIRSDRSAVLYSMPDKKSAKIETLEAHTVLKVYSATANWYKVQLPDGREGFVTVADINDIDNPIRTFSVDTEKLLLDKPDSLAASKITLAKNEKVQVLGGFNDYYYVKKNESTGWIAK